MLTIYTAGEVKKDFQIYLKNFIANLSKKPVLNILQIGDDFASSKYVEIKRNLASSYGITVEVFRLDSQTSVDEVRTITRNFQEKNQPVIFQLPVKPEYQAVINDLKYQVDADLLGLEANKLIAKGFLPPTILAIHLVLEGIFEPHLELSQKLRIKPDFLTGKTVAVIGQGKLVGMPMLDYLVKTGATITSLNEHTKNIRQLTQRADIVISATGKSNLIDASYLTQNCIVIDAGTSESNGALVGDVDKSSLENSEKNITLVPSPGGIGKLTVLSLFWNVARLT